MNTQTSTAAVSTPDAGSHRSGRLRRIVKWLSITVLAWSTIGFGIVPLLLKHVAIPQINKRLTGRASLERAYCNPYSLGLILVNFKVEDAGGRTLASFERFDGRFEFWASIFKGGWRFERAVTQRPVLAIELEKDGRLNVVKLRKPEVAAANAKPAEGLKKLPRIVIHDLRVLKAGASFSDLTTPEPFFWEFKDADFGMVGLDTRPDNNNPHLLTASTADGEKVTWEGEFHLDPLTSKGTLTAEHIKLSRFVPYTLRYSPARVTKGDLSATVNIEFAPVRAPRVARATVTTATLREFAVMQPGGPLVEAPLVTLTNAVADADSRSLLVESVMLDKPGAHLRRDEKGVLNLEKLLTVPAASRLAARANRPDVRTIQYPIEQLVEAITQFVEDVSAGWTLGLNRVELKDAAADWTDKALGAPVNLRVSEVTASLGPISSAERFRTPVQLRAIVGETGKAEVKGIILPMDMAADIEAKVDGMDLARIAPYLPEKLGEQLPPVRLAGAILTLQGKAAVSIPETGASSASWSGDLKLTSVRVDNAAGGPPVAIAESLGLKGEATAAGEGHAIRTAAWKGDVSGTALTLEAPVAGPTKLTLATLAVASEEAGATIDAAGAAALVWKGKLSGGGLDLAMKGEAPATVKSATLSLEGAARAALTDKGLGDAAWSGLTGMSGLAAEVAGAAPAAVGFESLAISGDASISEAKAAAWKGILRGGNVSAKVGGASESSATIGTLTLDGQASAPLAEGPRTLTWAGAANLAALAAKIGGAAAADLSVETLAITGDSHAEMAEAGAQSAGWKGELHLTNASVNAMPENPAKIKLASASVKGEAGAMGLSGGTPDLRFAGDAETGAIELESPQRAALKATIVSIVAKAADLSTGEKRVSVADVLVERPVLSAETALLPPPTDPKVKSEPPQALLLRLREMVPFQFKIAHAKIANVAYDLRDSTAQPPLALHGEDGMIEVTNLANDGASVADLTVTARSQETGQVRFAGKLDLFRAKPFADVQAQVAGMPLKPYDAVAGRYAGYLIDQGRMAIKLPMKIEDGHLKGTLDFDFDKLYLGQAVKSPDAPDVPLELGLALLRDTNEHVKGQIPISGNIDEPGFSVAGLVVQAFMGLIVKAATAPFQILGALLDAGEGEDLSFIGFDPGAATMPPESLAKLDKLAKGLSDRPGLKMDVAGRVSEKEDLPALRKETLQAQLLTRAKQRDSSLAALTPEQYAEGVTALYHEQRGEQPPRLKKGEAAPVSLADMEKTVLAAQTVDPQRLAALSKQRAAAVQNVLVRDNAIAVDRVAIVEDAEDKGENKVPRADLRLRK